MTCCKEYACRRTLPIKIRRGYLSDRWYAITKYTVKENWLTASQKHDITDDLVAALLDAGWTPPEEER